MYDLEAARCDIKADDKTSRRIYEYMLLPDLTQPLLHVDSYLEHHETPTAHMHCVRVTGEVSLNDKWKVELGKGRHKDVPKVLSAVSLEWSHHRGRRPGTPGLRDS